MIQMHSIIMWAKETNEDFETSVKKAYNMMQILKYFGNEINPTYLSVSRKREAKPFNWTYDTFKELVKNSANREDRKVFTDLGYSFSFFSSLNSKESSSINMSIGITNPRFKNTFIVHLPQLIDVINDAIDADRMALVFERCIEVFEPFWGCIANKINMSRFDGYMKNMLPTTIHWINYFGEDLIHKIGIEKIEKAPGFMSKKISNGYLLKLITGPINDEDKNSVNNQSKLNRYFGL